MNEYFGYITGCDKDNKAQRITIYIFVKGVQGIASLQSLNISIESREKIYDFFKNFPVFTSEGKLDLEWLVGSPVYVKLVFSKDKVKVIDIKYDCAYYLADSDEWLNDSLMIWERSKK